MTIMKSKYWICSVLILLFAPPVVLYVFYMAGIRELPEHPPPDPEKKYPPQIYEVLWIFHGGKGEIRMEPIEIKHIFFSFYIDDLEELDRLSPVSIGVSSASGRLLLKKRHPSLQQKGYFHRTVASIWVSRNWTAKEALNSIAGWSYFGYDIYGLENAAKTYFNKITSDLSIEETIVLVSILWSPNTLNPWCYPENLLRKSNSLIENYNMAKNRLHKINKMKSLPVSLTYFDKSMCKE